MAVMSGTAQAGPYVADGVQKEFPFDFKVLDAKHLAVWLDSSRVQEGYSVTIRENGGVVLFAEPPKEESLISVLRSIPITQETDLQNNAAFLPEVIEDAFDKLTMICQQLAEALSRTLQVSPTETGDVSAAELLPELRSQLAAANQAAQSAQSAVKTIQQTVETVRSDAATAKSDAATAKSDAATAKSDAATAKSDAAKKLPLAGGTMTGDLVFNPSNGSYQMYVNSSDGRLAIFGGNKASAGGVLRLIGIDDTGNYSCAGGWRLTAADGTNLKGTMEGRSDGNVYINSKEAVAVTWWHNGYSWYRKYADGFIEQGGIATVEGTTATVSLFTNFSDTKYKVNANVCTTAAASSYNAHYTAMAMGLTKSSFVIKANASSAGVPFAWYACGY